MSTSRSAHLNSIFIPFVSYMLNMTSKMSFNQNLLITHLSS